MKKNENNIAYIDAANLYFGARALGWEIDYARFRVWLAEKHSVKTAYLFIGLIVGKSERYTALQQAGFILIFKETIWGIDGKPKGNCDADLVLQATQDNYEATYNKAVLMSSDGDYGCLVKFLQTKGRRPVIISPNNKCSILLRRTNAQITYLDTLRSLVEIRKEKAPDADGTA